MTDNESKLLSFAINLLIDDYLGVEMDLWIEFSKSNTDATPYELIKWLSRFDKTAVSNLEKKGGD
jgi:hypothetical protein